MNITQFLDVVQSTGLAERIRNSLYLFPLIESSHVIGLTMVFGTTAVMDMRLLGLASTHRSFRKVARDVVPWTWAAFGLTLITGLLMFITNATVYFHNTQFRLKMLAIALAGINMLVFEFTGGRTSDKWDDGKPPVSAKLAGVLSLLLWISVVFFGRWIGFTTTANPTPAEDIQIPDIFK